MEKTVYVDSVRCNGCGACLESCPTGALALADGLATIEQAKCDRCEACVEACPEGAILAVETLPVRELEPAVARTVQPQAQPARATAVRPTARLFSQLGLALAFVGREIVPRVAAALLDAWDRRMANSSRELGTATVAKTRLPTLPSKSAGQHRWRRGRER